MQKNNATFAAIVFLVLAIAFKFLPLAPNVACFGALSLFCGIYLRGIWMWVIPVGGMALSDLMGELLQIPGVYRYHTLSMLLNYTGFAAAVGIGSLLRKVQPLHQAIGGGVASSLAYFLISNFGCFFDPLMNYEQSVQGFINCYIMAIPFWKQTLMSDLLFSAVFIFSYRKMFAYSAVEANA